MVRYVRCGLRLTTKLTALAAALGHYAKVGNNETGVVG
jgi:hypothetical protein